MIMLDMGSLVPLAGHNHFPAFSFTQPGSPPAKTRIRDDDMLRGSHHPDIGIAVAGIDNRPFKISFYP
jgi:hypothetical protein